MHIGLVLSWINGPRQVIAPLWEEFWLLGVLRNNQCFARSIEKEEFRVMAHVVCEMLWLKILLKSLTMIPKIL
jgi:hypothetical protein